MVLKYNQKLLFRAREMRNNSTKSEIELWKRLRKGKLGVRFLRQKTIDQYIVDFYCPFLKLAIEIDGKIHDFQREQDKFRQGELEALGVRFLRFSDEEVLSNTKEVVRKIREKIEDVA